MTLLPALFIFFLERVEPDALERHDENSLDCINRIYQRSLMQTKKSQPDGKQIMPRTRFTGFPEVSVGPSVEVSWSASEGDRCFIIFRTYDIKNYYLSFVPSLIFDIQRHITSVFKRHSFVFFAVVQK